MLPKVLRTFCGMENCTQYVIGPDGELYKCEHSVGKPDEIVGDVYTGSYYSYMEMVSILKYQKSVCKKLVNFFLCVWADVQMKDCISIIYVIASK